MRKRTSIRARLLLNSKVLWMKADCKKDSDQ